jgi:glutamate racemase
MDEAISPLQPIGIFDSGVGGLSVLKAIRQELPHESVLYFGDQAHIPYGPRSKEEIQEFSVAITRFLLDKGAKLIVVACNTASAAALHHLRGLFSNIPFVGMEPAVKPAAETTQTGKVGVLATPTTFAGDLYASVVERFGQHVEIFKSTCPGLVEQIEAGQLDSPKTRSILTDALEPMLDQGIDTVVMGCTHYPFVIPLIQSITGPDVRTIDPAPAIARQVRRLLDQRMLLNTNKDREKLEFYTSGDMDQLAALLPRLLGESGVISKVAWDDDQGILEKDANPPG